MASPGPSASDADSDRCPCGTSVALAECCGRFIDGDRDPPTAEALMRSRYSAFVLARADYLLATWHPDTRPDTLDMNTEQRWLGLKIVGVSGGAESDSQGTVEFVARFKIAGRGHRLHEISRFGRVDGRWRYLDGSRGGTDSSRRK